MLYDLWPAERQAPVINTQQWRVAPPPPDGFRLDLDGVAGSLRGPLPARLLYNRGIRSSVAAKQFLNPTASALSDPFAMPDMDKAARRLLQAIRADEPVGVFGDFDVDGLTGTAVVLETIRHLGGRSMPYIPHREQDGHGLSIQAIEAFVSAGVKLLITVDTGTTAIDEVRAARQAGIETIITDHHLTDGDLPAALAIVNPHLASEAGTEFSGSGVAFKLAQAVCSLAGVDWPGPIIALAALGTIADSAPLTGENRTIVREGLEELGRTRHAGLRALLECSRPRGSHGRPDTELISFYVAPRLNAPGRLGDAEPSMRILTTDDPNEAAILASRLDSLNNERKRLGEQAWEAAMSQLARLGTDEPVTVVRCDGFPAGLLGPLAGRLCDRYGRPAIAYAVDDGIARASARSLPAFDIHASLQPHGAELERFGGHARAAGFTVRLDRLNGLVDSIRGRAAWAMMGAGSGPVLDIDAEAPLESIGASMWDFVKVMEPFGEANTQPLLVSRGLSPTNVRTIGRDAKHLRITLECNGRKADAIGFGLGEADLGRGNVDVVYSLRTDNWNGQVRKELQLRDIRPSTP